MHQRLGGLEIKSVHESEGRIPMQLALPGVTAADLAALKRWHWSEELSLDPHAAVFRIDVRSYLLHVDGLNVLIDACCGNDNQRSVPWAHQLQTNYLGNLAAAGCSPEDIHLVLCTHLHADPARHMRIPCCPSSRRGWQTSSTATTACTARSGRASGCRMPRAIHREVS